MRKREEREEPPYCTFFLGLNPRTNTQSIIKLLLVENIIIFCVGLRQDCHLLLQNGYLKLTSHPISKKLIVWVMSQFSFSACHNYIFKNTLGSNILCLLCLNIIIITFFLIKFRWNKFSTNNYKKYKQVVVIVLIIFKFLLLLLVLCY